jgi:hypothetical protein
MATIVLFVFASMSAQAEKENVYQYTITSAPGWTAGSVTGIIQLPEFSLDPWSIHSTQPIGGANAVSISSAPGTLPSWAPKLPAIASNWQILDNRFRYTNNSFSVLNQYSFHAVLSKPNSSSFLNLDLSFNDYKSFLTGPIGELSCIFCNYKYIVYGPVTLKFLYAVYTDEPHAAAGGSFLTPFPDLSPVPEPSSLALLLTGGALVWSKRRHRFNNDGGAAS